MREERKEKRDEKEMNKERTGKAIDSGHAV
jgi:hypothetical protein